MRISNTTKATVLNVMMIIGLLCLFGTPARASVAANPAAASFGNQTAGMVSAPINVVLTNSNNHSITISSASLTGASFSFSGPAMPVTLAAGQTLSAAVTFKPATAQSYSGTLVFTRSTGSTTSIALSGTGIVVAPVISTQPKSQAVNIGQTATFSVGATSSMPMTFQWMKNSSAISGATSSTYTTPAEIASDNNVQFTVVVSNAGGNVVSSAAILTVNTAAAGCVNSSGTWANTSLSGTGSGSFRVTFDATPSGTNMDGVVGLSTGPASDFTNLAAIVWFNTSGNIVARNAGAYASLSTIPYVAGTSYHFILDVNATAHTYNAYVMIGSVQTTIGSGYGFRTEQAAASSLSNVGSLAQSAGVTVCNATLSITQAAVAPSITSQPVSKTITAGQTATFNVAATGTSPMTYQWMKNGAAISGAASSTYTTPAETTSDNGAQFSVTLGNSAGNATSNAAMLTINAAVVAPSITSQPVSKTINAGQTATFNVAATGTAPMTYQWMKNGAAISGATSSTYTTAAETTSDNGAQFSIAVSNAAGNATSTAATLTINAGTLLLNSSASSLSFGSVNVSSSSTQNVTLTNAGNAVVTISGVSISGAGFNVSGVSSGLMLNPAQTITLTATFSPSGSGIVAGSIAVASNATNSPDTIALSGTGVAVVNHTVTLGWTASTSPVMGYNTYSSTVSGGPYTKLTSSPSASMTYTDNTVLSGHTYYYVVTAVDSNSVESANSTQSTAIIP